MAVSGLQSSRQALSGEPTRLPNLRFERMFFSGLAAFILLSVFIGFAQSYYLQGVPNIPHWRAFNAPPYPFLVQLHGAVFTLWILLLIAQTSLVAAHQVKLHRRLGIAGFVLACMLVAVGLMVVCESMARHVPPGNRGIGFQASALFNVLGFAILASLGYRQRRNPSEHKRLMMLATISLLPAAFSRWPVFHDRSHLRATACCLVLVALIACYDFWSAAKVYAATLWGGAALLVLNPPIVAIFILNSVWFRISLELQKLGRHLY